MEGKETEHYLECINCHATYRPDEVIYECKRCGDLLEVKYDYTKVATNVQEKDWLSRPLNVWRYKELLPIQKTSQIISLQEGGTSLQHCSRLGGELGLKSIYVKNEGENPTGSFKDRGMTVGVTKVMELGLSTVACASTGNTSASLAAYAAKAGLSAVVFIPSGKIALGKLTQAIIHGAKIVQVQGSFFI